MISDFTPFVLARQKQRRMHRQLNASTLFAVCLLLPSVLSAEISSGVFLIIVLGLSGVSANLPLKKLLYVLTPLGFMFAVGLRGFSMNIGYDAMKDAWYLLKLVMLLTTGYYLMGRMRNVRLLFRAIALGGVLAAFWHGIQILDALRPGDTLVDVRLSGVTGHLITAIALAMLLGARKIYRRMGFSDGWILLLAIVCVSSLVLSMSRTYWIAFVVLLIFLMTARMRMLSISIAVAVAVAVVGAAITILSLQLSVDPASVADSSLLERIVSSITEVWISDYSDIGSINDRWRGFESFRALMTFLEAAPVDEILGGGFGALVELGMVMELGGVDFSSIPMLHNGYLYVVVKYGIVGLFLYGMFFYRLLRSHHARGVAIPESLFVYRLRLGLIIVTLLGTLVVTGLFNKDVFDATALILGALIYYDERVLIKRKPTGGVPLLNFK